MSSWDLYQSLLDILPDALRVSEVNHGSDWTLVRLSDGSVGVSATQPGCVSEADFIDLPVKDAAYKIKSWNFAEAAVASAVINATLNRMERFSKQENPDAFLRYRDKCLGKNVSVIGHFAYLESRLQNLCNLNIIERIPHDGDYPDPACEYLLPEMDVVFITGSALSNKTLPRLLELSQKAFTVISGPSTPMSEVLFEFGANALCGFCVNDAQAARTAAEGHNGLFQSGQMVCLERRESTL